MRNATFIDGDCTTRFIDETPELFDFPVAATGPPSC